MFYTQYLDDIDGKIRQVNYEIDEKNKLVAKDSDIFELNNPEHKSKYNIIRTFNRINTFCGNDNISISMHDIHFLDNNKIQIKFSHCYGISENECLISNYKNLEEDLEKIIPMINEEGMGMKLELVPGYEVELYKSEYENGRLGIAMFDEQGLPFGNLTVNLPDNIFFSEINEPQPNAAFIDQFSAFISYNKLINWLEENDLVEIKDNGTCVQNIVQSGFNRYVEVIFKQEALDKMHTL